MLNKIFICLIEEIAGRVEFRETAMPAFHDFINRDALDREHDSVPARPQLTAPLSVHQRLPKPAIKNFHSLVRTENGVELDVRTSVATKKMDLLECLSSSEKNVRYPSQYLWGFTV